MAIKIIKNTLTDPINKICDECGSEFEFNYDDVQRTTSMGIFGDMMSRRFVVCPVCKHECSFKVNKLEEKWWEKEQCDLSKKVEELKDAFDNQDDKQVPLKWGTGKDAEVIGIANLEVCGDGVSMSMDKETYERLMEKINGQNNI